MRGIEESISPAPHIRSRSSLPIPLVENRNSSGGELFEPPSLICVSWQGKCHDMDGFCLLSLMGMVCDCHDKDVSYLFVHV